MTDAPAPAAPPAAPAAPAAATPPGGAPPAAGTPPPAAPTRPEWLPEAHWDPQASAIKLDDFGKHYGELATFHKAQTEAQAALAARKPEDIKIEVKLPDTVKVPDGMELKVDEKDPRVVQVRALAQQHQLPQEAVNALVAFDAMEKIATHNAEQARIAEADKSLGANATERKSAIGGWLKGMLDRGEITKEEHADATELATYATTITLFEKLMAKAAGSVPGAGAGAPPTPPKPADLPIEKRWYGTQQKVS